MKGKGTKLGEKQKEYKNGGKCAKCLRHHPSLTVEHIIPAHMLIDLGLADLAYEDADNFEPLCLGCNHLKGPRLDPLHPKTHKLLARYVVMSRDKYAKLLEQVRPAPSTATPPIAARDLPRGLLIDKQPHELQG